MRTIQKNRLKKRILFILLLIVCFSAIVSVFLARANITNLEYEINKFEKEKASLIQKNKSLQIEKIQLLSRKRFDHEITAKENFSIIDRKKVVYVKTFEGQDIIMSSLKTNKEPINIAPFH